MLRLISELYPIHAYKSYRFDIDATIKTKQLRHSISSELLACIGTGTVIPTGTICVGVDHMSIII